MTVSSKKSKFCKMKYKSKSQTLAENAVAVWLERKAGIFKCFLPALHLRS
jgi:hypothetical protein